MAPAAPVPVVPAQGVPAGGRAPVNQKKQYILERIAKNREATDEAIRLKQEAEDREKRSTRERSEMATQVQALDTQIAAFRTQVDAATKERDETRGRMQALQNLLAVSQKDKESIEAEASEMRTALDEIQKALG